MTKSHIMTQVIKMLERKNIKNWAIADEHYGNSHDGPLKKIYVDRLILNPGDFNKYGFHPVVIKPGRVK